MSIDLEKLQHIIDRCKRQKQRAQQELYEHFYSYGMNIALHYSSNREEAEEILHDSFVKTFQRLRQCHGATSFKSWFRKIIITSAIDYYRKFKQHEFDPVLIRMEHRRTTENDAISQLNLEDAWFFLQNLSPRYRMVFNLFVLEHFTHKEIASKLGISVGTSKSNLAKAKQKLSEQFSHYFNRQMPHSHAKH